MGAIGERIAEAPGKWVEDLGAAGGARGRVRRNPGLGPRRHARRDVKSGIGGQRRRRSALDAIDARQGRRLARQREHEVLDGRGRAAHMNSHAVAVVGDPPAQSMPLRQTPHGRTKTDSLHHSSNPDECRRLAHATSSAASGHSATRLLPESAITARSPQVPIP